MADASAMENGNIKGLSREMRHGRTAHNMSTSSLRKKSDLSLVNRVRVGLLRTFLVNLQEVLLGTKLSLLFLAIPFAIVTQYCHFGNPWVFALSLLGITPLAERVSFLTEQITFYTGPTVGGLLNATCGNATEMIIAILALVNHKVSVVKYSQLGSILSNLLLVLGSSLFCGGIANISKQQKFNRKQADVNSLLLFLGLLCHVLPLMFKFAGKSMEQTTVGTLQLSRASCIIMLIAYIAYLIFQLRTHRQLFENQEEDDVFDDDVSDDTPIIGFWSGFIWLILMTGIIAVLSEYVVATIEDASNSWRLSGKLHQRDFTTNCGKCSRTCRGYHFRIQEQIGYIFRSGTGFSNSNCHVRGPCKCNRFLDHGYQHGSRPQYPRNKYSCHINSGHSIHFTRWNITLYEGFGSSSVLCCYWLMLLCVQNAIYQPCKCCELRA